MRLKDGNGVKNVQSKITAAEWERLHSCVVSSNTTVLEFVREAVMEKVSRFERDNAELSTTVGAQFAVEAKDGWLSRLTTFSPLAAKPGEIRSDSPEYRCWKGAINRCYRKKTEEYPLYGGRGITVCDRWRQSCLAFVLDMGPRPGPEYSLDRIDVNGNYEPGNCRWATPRQQQTNRRDNRIIEAFGRSQCLSMWAREFNMPISTVTNRLLKGAHIEDALTRPVVNGAKSGRSRLS